jgi:hypothetical protein
MKTKSFYEQIREEFEDSDDTYCAYCRVLNGGNGCDCGNHAWRYFHQFDEASQREIINAEMSIPFGEKL